MEEQRIFTSFINIFVYFITKQWFARFLKTFIRLLPKLSAICTLRLCRSLCLRHLREIVCFHLRALPLSVCLLYVVGLIYHSIFRKNLLFLPLTSNSLTRLLVTLSTKETFFCYSVFIFRPSFVSLLLCLYFILSLFFCYPVLILLCLKVV